MEAQITWPSDAAEGRIEYISGDSIYPTTVTNFTPLTVVYQFQSAVAGSSPSLRVRARDAAGNWSATTESSYTLVSSPLLIAADASNSWRNEVGGRYNWAGNSRVYQGYFSDSALNSIGLWYYGTKIQSQTEYSGRRYVGNVEIYMRRNTGGDGVEQQVSLVLHNETVNPGTVYTAGPTIYTPGYSPLTPFPLTPLLQWGGGAAWMQVPSTWKDLLVNGTHKGLGIRDNDGKPYLVLDSVAENGFSGMLRITHLG
jgi:hypothetical protein